MSRIPLRFSQLFLSFVLLASISGTVSAQKVAVKPVEPFFREVPTETPAVYEPKVTYLSPEKNAPIQFSSLGATWSQKVPTGTSLTIEVRLKSKGKYSDWYVLEPSIDEKFEVGGNDHVSAFITTNLADSYQYRVTLNSQVATITPVLENLKFTFINGGTPGQRTNLLLAASSHHLTQVEENEYLPEDFNSELILQGTSSGLIKSTGLVGQAESPVILPTNVKREVKTIPSIRRSRISASGPKIISRNEWGADETLRIYRPNENGKEADLVKLENDYYTKYASELKENRRVETDESGNQLTWPLSYPESIKKIVIHHTATTKNLDDPKKAIRDIYVWHTLSKGWGDIGYNYIIDQQGNIYEGRFGGETVVGAHAGRGNHGSIGIAVLGNYQDEDPPEAVVTALTALIKSKAELYNIDTEGAGTFRGENYPNVMGHKDIMSTSCPGDRLYSMLPVIRKLAKAKTTTASAQIVSDYDFGWSASSAPVISMNPKAKKMAILKLKNTGKLSWPTDTYFKVRVNDNARIFLRNSQEILTGTAGREVKPGESVEIKVLLNSNATSGSALIDIQPIINGKNIEKYLSFGLQVAAPAPKLKYDYELISIIYGKEQFKKGDLVEVRVRLRNKGTAPWQKTGDNRLMLGADKPRDHLNKLLSNPSNRLAEMEESLVKSGESALFKFTIKVPEQDGVYKEYFTPVIEGVQWMENRNTFIQVKVGNSEQLITPEFEGEPISQHVKIAPIPSAPTPANPTPTGSSTVNVASEKMDVNAKPRDIRIDLAYRGNPAIISANGSFTLFEGTRKVADFRADQQVNVQYKDGIFRVTGNLKNYDISARPRFVPSPGTIMRIENWERRNTWGDKANNNTFRGVLEVLIYNNELHVINELPLEDYLKGIAEESSTAPDDKIKTIMVIARTYARFYMDVAKKFPGAPFDLTDDPNSSQKYLGYAFESRSPKTARLASETAGQYVNYQGKLIKTPYFSKSDGKRTISAQAKWGWVDTPFLAGVDDSHCKSSAFSGHGVGLSGCGATALAEQGKNYKDIIKYYYQGTEVVQAAY